MLRTVAEVIMGLQLQTKILKQCPTGLREYHGVLFL